VKVSVLRPDALAVATNRFAVQSKAGASGRWSRSIPFSAAWKTLVDVARYLSQKPIASAASGAAATSCSSTPKPLGPNRASYLPLWTTGRAALTNVNPVSPDCVQPVKSPVSKPGLLIRWTRAAA
jgi:hypothetical protein